MKANVVVILIVQMNKLKNGGKMENAFNNVINMIPFLMKYKTIITVNIIIMVDIFIKKKDYNKKKLITFKTQIIIHFDLP